MLRALLLRQIDRFERTWGYDASYMRRLAHTAPGSCVRFGFGTTLVDRTPVAHPALAA